MKPLVIYGKGGLGREILQIVRDLNRVEPTFEFLGFLDDSPGSLGTLVQERPVLGGMDWLANNPEVGVLLGVGSPPVRAKIAGQIAPFNPTYPILISPHARVGEYVRLGEGTVVAAGAIITTDIEIGQQVVVDRNSDVGHDSVVGDFVNISPNACLSGGVRLGKGCHIGTGATLLPQVCVGEWSIVGGGALVNKNLPAHVTAVGVPARVIKRRDGAS